MPRPYVPPPNLPPQARPPVHAGVSRGETFTHHDAEGNPVAGVFMIVTPEAYDTHKGVLEQYLHQPPLPRVWAGDDASDPFLTAVVKFPNQAAADAALAAMEG